MRRISWLPLILAVTAFSQTPRSLARDMLAAHNAVRAQIGIPPLTWSSVLAAHAQTWADTLIARHDFSHTPHSPYGQNLYEITGGTASPNDVVSSWADEARDYNYETNKCRGMCGHFTQLVWLDTKQVGCAVARSSSRNNVTEIWVCDYDPPGNWVGKRPW